MNVTELLQPKGTSSDAAEVVLDVLHQVLDPEVGVNIVDLGLVRDVDVDLEAGRIDILMTLTTPACPLGPYMEQEINDLLHQAVWVADVAVTVTFEPPWDPHHDMTDEAKRQLGWL